MAYRLVEALWTCERQQFNPVVSLQLPWSLLKRDGERELIPAARHFGLGVMAYSPLARGMLTGKHRPATPAPGSRMDQWRDEWRENDRARTWEINALLGEIAGQHECAHSAVALAWLLAQRPLASVVLGARSSAQLQENLQCTRLQLSAQQLAQLDLLSAPDWGYPCDFIRRFEPW
jgi:aryl-alcohol dehydrogenase-like predicted oxidoreductase